jgi:glucose/arabinose dehydrogenase
VRRARVNAVPKPEEKWYNDRMSEQNRKLLSTLVLSAAAIAIALFAAQNIVLQTVKTAPFVPGKLVPPTPSAAVPPGAPKEPVTVLEDLRVPWEVVDAGGGAFLVTERPGSVRRFVPGGEQRTYAIPNVADTGEGGLMGMTFSPDRKYLYLYMTGRKGIAGLTVVNRVIRYAWTDAGPKEDKVILDDIPSQIYHDGGRIAFGPDGMLYVATGDAGNSRNAQNTSSLSGKILRITADGGIPADNPFGNAVWSYGHRNVQGLAWDDKGRLWATEHGRSGAQSGFDELNLIVKGGNYGWPDIQGDQKKAGMITPVINSGPDVTWAPSGLAWLDGSLWFAGLRGETLYEAVPSADGKSVDFREHLKGQYGRLRAVQPIGGRLYVTTSNTDGRGKPRPGDDRILEIDPAFFRQAR